jgi:hypothetical protein
MKTVEVFEEHTFLGYAAVYSLACHLFARWFTEPIFSTLKMEAICSSETSVETKRTTRRHIPEDYTRHNHRCENLKSYTVEGFICRSFNLGYIPSND